MIFLPTCAFTPPDISAFLSPVACQIAQGLSQWWHYNITLKCLSCKLILMPQLLSPPFLVLLICRALAQQTFRNEMHYFPFSDSGSCLFCLLIHLFFFVPREKPFAETQWRGEWPFSVRRGKCARRHAVTEPRRADLHQQLTPNLCAETQPKPYPLILGAFV